MGKTKHSIPNFLRSSPSPLYREITFGKSTTAQDGPSKNNVNLFCTNSVTTAKYNFMTFVPRSLFEQFRRVANAYFLLISMLMLIGTYTTFFDSPLQPWSTLIPLLVVLLISTGKEGVEDLKRHYADKQMNNKAAHKLNTRRTPTSSDVFEDVRWKDVQVGYVLCIHNNEEMPADLLLLATGEPTGCAYIETSNIDGENNLKIKHCVHTGVGDQTSAFATPEQLRSAELRLQCEHPNSAIHHFLGTITFQSREISVDASNLLLRGSSLRNTRWALGLVVYTGRETKIVMNSRAAPSKLSSIERTMNNLIYLIFSTQVLISTISLICYVVWKNFNYDKLDYLCYNFANSYNPLYAKDCKKEGSPITLLPCLPGRCYEYNDAGYWFTFFILFNNFMPISLYVTVELCNYIQAYYVDNDVKMYDATSDTPALARTSNMNGDLGMVEYVFSDKTGTLTQNDMRFKRCSVGGLVYGDSPRWSDPEGGVPSRDGDAAKQSSGGGGSGGQGSMPIISNELKGAPLRNLLDASLRTEEPLGLFVQALALCHTVVVEVESGALQSESPDEEALVVAAGELGWAFRGRSSDSITIESTHLNNMHDIGLNPATPVPANPSLHTGLVKNFVVLAVVPFDSTRKRMSVVVRDSEGKLLLICKGADNIIFERSSGYVGNCSKEVMEAHLDLFASDGLRTLLIAIRPLSEEEYTLFATAWQQARTSLANRTELMQSAAVLLERDLLILGATAIEDRLQDGVPETIADLGDAGVKVWVLTGDKVETAINIGYSSRLLGPDMVVMKLTDRGEDAVNVRRRLRTLIDHLSRITRNDALVLEVWKKLQSTIKSVMEKKAERTHSYNSGHRHTTGIPLVVNPMISAVSDLDHSTSAASVSPLVGNNNRMSTNSQAHSRSRSANSNEGQSALDDDGMGGVNINQLFFRKDSKAPQVTLDQLTCDHLALIVDGDTLMKIFGDPLAERRLLTLATICKAVIACRVSPEQKRLMVRLVKRGVHPRPITLAIGDGANDVAMIQEAQIGVGISGREGRQAVNSSDFAIAQFRFLKRLMLVHGRWDYRRISKVVIFSFYKNIVLTLVLFAFTFYSGYSGQSLFDDYIYSGYNFFLALPVVGFGIFDRDISAESLERYKMLYVSGRERLDMNIPVLGKQLVLALIDAVFTFFIPYLCYSACGGVWGQGMGEDSGMWVLGTTVFTCLVISMFLRAMMLTCTWTAFSIAFFVFSAALYIAFVWVYQYVVASYNFFGVTTNMVSESTFWLLCLLVPSFSIILELASMALQREFAPSLVDIGAEFDAGLGLGQMKQAGEDLLPNTTELNVVTAIPLVAVGSPHLGVGGNSDDVLGRIGKVVAEGSLRGALLSAGATSSSESILKFSSVVAGGGRPPKFPLDWKSVKDLYASLAPREKEGLGLSSTSDPAPTAYNYDHVTSEYGPGAGAGATGMSSYLMMPYQSISSAMNLFNIFGTPRTNSASNLLSSPRSAPESKSNNQELKKDEFSFL